MSLQITDPLVASGICAGGVGALLWASASLQTRALRRRIVTGSGTTAFDPGTGLFSAAAAIQCMRAEANRAHRLETHLNVWVGTGDDAASIDIAGRDLAMTMPGPVSGIRLSRSQLCLVSCVDWTPPSETPNGHLVWTTTQLDASPTVSHDALAWVAQQVVQSHG